MIPKLLTYIRGLRENVIEHTGWEMVLMRLCMLYPFYRAIGRKLPAVQPHPNGLAHFFDLTFLAQPAVIQATLILSSIAAFFYVSGWFMIPALTILTGVLVLQGTLINSQGAINHALQLLTMVVMAQWLVYIFGAVRKLPRHRAHLLAVHWAKIIIAASYVTAAFSKLFASSEFWIARVPYLALQVIKSNLQTYYNRLEPNPSVIAEKFPYWVLEFPNAARLFFGAGLALELFAFLALVSRGWALFIGLSMLMLHFSIQVIMTLEFKHHVYLLMIFYVNAPWLLYAGGKWVANRFTGGKVTSSAT